MPRVARIVVPEVPHHITQRGNNRQDVFFVDDDRRVYLELLKQQSSRFGLNIIGYCLMTNHVHIVGTPLGDESLARAVGRTHFLYTQYINRFHKRSGHLWQNRFHSCPLDEYHLWQALCYLERNPVRARMVRKAWRYDWSSARAHVDGKDPTDMLDIKKWSRKWGGDEWRDALQEPQDEDLILRLRSSTHTGRPLGRDSFISKLESVVGRRLRPLPVGRPRNKINKIKKKGKRQRI